MASLATIRRQYEQRHAHLFNRAREIDRRLTEAMALETINASRLEELRGKVRSAVRNCNARELAHYLELWGPCFDTTIAAAERFDDLPAEVDIALPADAYVPARAA